MSAKIPLLDMEKFKDFITSRELIIVGSAILLTPLLQATVDSLAQSIPFLAEHASLALILIAFVIFVISSKLPSFLKQIGIGFAMGLAITAIAPLIPIGGVTN